MDKEKKEKRFPEEVEIVIKPEHCEGDFLDCFHCGLAEAAKDLFKLKEVAVGFWSISIRHELFGDINYYLDKEFNHSDFTTVRSGKHLTRKLTRV